MEYLFTKIERITEFKMSSGLKVLCCFHSICIIVNFSQEPKLLTILIPLSHLYAINRNK